MLRGSLGVVVTYVIMSLMSLCFVLSFICSSLCYFICLQPQPPNKSTLGFFCLGFYLRGLCCLGVSCVVWGFHVSFFVTYVTCVDVSMGGLFANDTTHETST